METQDAGTFILERETEKCRETEDFIWHNNGRHQKYPDTTASHMTTNDHTQEHCDKMLNL